MNVEETNKTPIPQESIPPPPPPPNTNNNLKEGEMAIKMTDYVALQAELMTLRPQVATLLEEKKALEEKVALLQDKQEEWMKTGMSLVERANKINKGCETTPNTVLPQRRMLLVQTTRVDVFAMHVSVCLPHVCVSESSPCFFALLSHKIIHLS